MAGQGFKDFTVGEVLTAADVDNYLMQQTVMRFADASARGSALGTAVLAEGMTTYLDDNNALEFYDGSGWQRAVAPYGTATPTDGQILAFGTATSTWNPIAQIAGIGSNVVYGTIAGTITTTTNTDVVDVTITPSSTSSSILLIGQITHRNSTVGLTHTMRFKRNASLVGASALYGFMTGSQVRPYPLSLVILDSPNTTSAVTYDLNVATTGGTLTAEQRNIIAIEVAG